MTIATPQVMQVQRIMQTRTIATMTPGDKTVVTPGVVVVLKLGCVVGMVGIAVVTGRSEEGRLGAFYRFLQAEHCVQELLGRKHMVSMHYETQLC